MIEALQGKADVYPLATASQLGGDGVITATELYLYLRNRIEVATTARNRCQTPGIHPMTKHDKGEFIFLTPGHQLNLPPAPPLDESRNPYRGLSVFETQHSELFFGRSKLTQALQSFVEMHSFTVVLGPSGVGKSSLVRAGLIPSLQQDTTAKQESQWYVLPPVRPGEAPFQALNQTLVTAGLSAIETQNPAKTLAQSIQKWAQENPTRRLLIFVDQTEEIVTLCFDKTERQAFVQQLLTAVERQSDRLRIVLTVRSDFEPQIRKTGLIFAPGLSGLSGRLGQAVLKRYWQRGRFIVPAMTRSELREAIEEPAEARVMYFQSDDYDLVTQLIDEVAEMPGALPLLSFALSELYLRYLKRQQIAQRNGTIIDRALTQTDYEALGGVIQSLTQRASQEYEALVSQNQIYSQAIRHTMLRMVALGGGELVRRRVPLFELEYSGQKQQFVESVIERFSAARLLVKGQDAQGHSYVEPAHDALVRGWDKLQSWLAEEKDLVLQRRLTPVALEWSACDQPLGRSQSSSRSRSKFLWSDSPYLDVLEQVLKQSALDCKSNNWLNKVETAFVQQSLRKRRRSQRRLAASVLIFVLGLSGFAAFAGYQWRQAAIGQIRALSQSSQANFTANRSASAALIDALSASERLQRLPLARRDNQLRTDTLKTLIQSVIWVREKNQSLDHQDTIQSISFSPDGQMIVTGSYDNTVKLWKRNGSLFKTLVGHTATVMSVAFSPDSQLIASGSYDGTLRLWDSSGSLIWMIDAHEANAVNSVSFGPDGVIATASSDRTIKLWQVENGQLLSTLAGHQDIVRRVGFSPTGNLVTASDDGIVKLWNQNGEALTKTIASHSEGISDIEISLDGHFFATSSLDRTAKIWDFDGALIKTLPHPGEVWSVSISEGAQTITTGGEDGVIRLWNQAGRLIDSWPGHEGPIPDGALSPDGTVLATAGNDGSLKLWQVARNWLTVLAASESSALDVEFSPDGAYVASANADGTAMIWNRADQKLLALASDRTQANTISFSPNSQVIASGGDDGTIGLWNIRNINRDTGKQPQSTLFEPEVIAAHKDRVTSTDFHPKGEILASASADGTTKLWNLEGELLAVLEGHNDRVLSVAFSPDGQSLATGGDESVARLWNLNGEETHRLDGHTSSVESVEFSPDGTKIVTASYDKTLRLWQRDGTPVTTLGGHTAAVLQASFSPDGKMIASASSDRTIKLWHSDGTLITTLSGHQGSVMAVSFSSDSEWLASASSDSTVLLWKISDISLEKLSEKGCSHIRYYLENRSEGAGQLCRNL